MPEKIGFNFWPKTSWFMPFIKYLSPDQDKHIKVGLQTACILFLSSVCQVSGFTHISLGWNSIIFFSSDFAFLYFTCNRCTLIHPSAIRPNISHPVGTIWEPMVYYRYLNICIIHLGYIYYGLLQISKHLHHTCWIHLLWCITDI